MRGFITEREVLRHLTLIGREFGLRCLLRCLVALLRRERTTFLDLVLRDPP